MRSFSISSSLRAIRSTIMSDKGFFHSTPFRHLHMHSRLFSQNPPPAATSLRASDAHTEPPPSSTNKQPTNTKRRVSIRSNPPLNQMPPSPSPNSLRVPKAQHSTSSPKRHRVQIRTKKLRSPFIDRHSTIPKRRCQTSARSISIN